MMDNVTAIYNLPSLIPCIHPWETTPQVITGSTMTHPVISIRHLSQFEDHPNSYPEYA